MLTLNREDVAASLKAVLDHVGPSLLHLDFIGFAGPVIWATDRYTIGISTLFPPDAPADELPPAVYLPTKEARDLLKFVRPERVRDRDMRVEFLVAPSPEYTPSAGHPGEPGGPGGLELHVGIRPEDPNSDDITSEVYSLHPADYPMLDFNKLWEVVQDVSKHLIITDEFPLQAGLIARFKSAERRHGDRMHLYPASPLQGKSGPRAIVTVGSDFLGVMAGLGASAENTTDIPFGDSTLQDWGL